MNTAKNSTEARTRRRMAATRQALADGRTGVSQFEMRTFDPAARELCAALIDDEIEHLRSFQQKLRNPCPSVSIRG